MVWRAGAVIWTIAGCRLVIDPVITRERSERVVSEVIGEQERRIYALFHHDVFPPPPGLWEQGVPLGSG